MRPASLALLTISFLALTAPAFAECSDTLYGKLASAYVLKDVAVTASTEPVEQGGFTRSCGKLSGDVWQSEGSTGTTAREIDLSLFYDDQAGPVKYELSAQYYFVNLKGNSLLSTKDDLAEVYADVSIPRTYGRFTIAPVMRGIEMIGIRELPSETILQPGVRVAYAATEKLSLAADVRDSINLSERTSAWRFVGTLSYRFSPHLSGELETYGTSRTRSVLSVGFRYRY